MRIDLHTHSNASDGTDTPAALMRAAADAGLDVVAITDHDTTSGWAEAAHALPAGVALVRGMEMSCEGRGERGWPVAVHLLAYLFDPTHPEFAKERERLRAERVERIRVMTTMMARDGLPVDPDQILADAGPSVGRPHVAAALMRAGVVSSISEAFSDLLSSRGRYDVPKYDTPLEYAVELVAAAGGVTVLAHGRARSRGGLLALDHIRDLAALGLGGLEVDHPDHRSDDRDVLRRLAGDLGLAVTGSSDYHGENKTIGLGDELTDEAEFDKLVSAATGVEVLGR
ncbi:MULTISPECIES: PHP domain-containing protein [Rhodococcus]|uniref:PHP domain-containing protein n=1 Tax=Rhodococcus TaxID=1827 RepID=UPI001E458973|nr:MULTISPECIES: PHP domain-containing protein [Rhodococcus]MCD2108936.1 PHP domain-containing protein [Rhodococcus qingshengii]MCZ4524252.1 PHP domain-containing protein [Rhodococcus erythropolis]MDV8008859.1 PHP domain-containing protein [Rhodococcus sp. IEGM 1318]MDZ7915657.1 PHP domain-containing protein [Rhodococcus sp. (in: high G+C Gram-positive bacteria)]